MKDFYIDIREWNNWFRKRFNDKDFISLEELINDYENLIFDNERLEEEKEDIIQDRNDNYKPIGSYEMNGVSEKDFI